MALTHHDDLELMIGDEWLINGTLLDEDGKPLDLQSPTIALGWSLVGPDGNQMPGIAEAATLDKQAGGAVRIVVPDTFTRTLTPARYLDAIRVWVSGQPATQWTGVILADADPFHPTVSLMPPEPSLPGAIEDAPDDGKLYVRQGGQWVEMPSGFSMKFEFNFNNLYVPPPVTSRLRMNNADPALVTMIWVNNSDADDIDVSNLLTMVEAGFTVFVQDKDDPAKRARYLATGPMTNMGTYCELPVVLVAAAGGEFNDNQRLIMVVYGGG